VSLAERGGQYYIPLVRVFVRLITMHFSIPAAVPSGASCGLNLVKTAVAIIRLLLCKIQLCISCVPVLENERM
jgi:hypothetical protein